VRNLGALHGQVEVLRGIDFEARQGDVAVVPGGNGAGKTTTLRAICNIVISSGVVIFDGRDISRASTADIVNLGVAHLPQERGTLPELTMRDNLEVGGCFRDSGGLTYSDPSRLI
jgi:branched-chain amino acid transport system ATP-binding protein